MEPGVLVCSGPVSVGLTGPRLECFQSQVLVRGRLGIILQLTEELTDVRVDGG